MALQFNINPWQRKKKTPFAYQLVSWRIHLVCMKAGDDEDYHFILSEDDKKDVIHSNGKWMHWKKYFGHTEMNFMHFIVEPLLQGAGGMKMYSIDFLRGQETLQ